MKFRGMAESFQANEIAVRRARVSGDERRRVRACSNSSVCRGKAYFIACAESLSVRKRTATGREYALLCRQG